MELGAPEIRTFGAVADTLLPALDGEGALMRSSATELGLPQRLPDIFDLLPDDRARKDLRRLLRLLDTRSGGMLLYGRPVPFPALKAKDAEHALIRMATSRLGPARQGFKALKLLTAFLLGTPASGEQSTAVWDAIGYPGPDGRPPDEPKRLAPIAVDSASAWGADVVVVGSGAGGGVAAAVLAEAGLDVVVLEKGEYRNEADFTHVESEAFNDLYLDNNLGSTADSGIGMLAGSCLGGGTVVNYSTSFPTPPNVREEWDQVAGFDGVFTGDDYDWSSGAVQKRLGVNTNHNSPSSREVLMEKGLRSLGWHVATMPRNVLDCRPDECGYCGLGCRRGSKQSALRTWLEDAAAAGARIVVKADVRRVLVENGRGVGVEATVDGVALVVRARAVVIAAGGLNTPAILRRSRIGGPAAGRYLRLHPVSAIWGRFTEPLDPWTGILQAVYSDEFADLDGTGYGFKFETAPIHPVFPAVFFGWSDGAVYKRRYQQYRHWTPIGVLMRDRDAGRVTVRRDGSPVWKYRLSDHDTKNMRTGLLRAAQVLAEAGALEVLAPTSVPVSWDPASGESAESFLERVDAVGYGPNQTTYLSFHQMGSARMGSDRGTSVVGPENELHDTAGVFVLDASCFPTASGVNPMITIETIAHRGARALAAHLT